MTHLRRFRSAAAAAAIAACLVAGATPLRAADPVLVPPLPALAPVDPGAPSADLGTLLDSARQPAPPPPAARAEGMAMIQAGSFRVPGNAAALVQALSARGLPATAEPPAAGSRLHRVLVGPLPPEATGDALATLAGLGIDDAFVLAP